MHLQKRQPAASFALALLAPTMLLACGDGITPVDVVDIPAIDFGRTDCGQTADPQQFVLSNTRGGAYHFDITLSGGEASNYIVSPMSGVVLAGKQVLVTVTPRALPRIAETTENLFGETLTITTDDGEAPLEVPLLHTAQGAILEASATSVTINPTQVLGGPQVSGPLTITNRGNAATTVTVGSDGDNFMLAAPVEIAGGATENAAVIINPGLTGEVTDTLSLEATGALCAPLPTGIEATGTLSVVGQAVTPHLVGPLVMRDPSQTLCVITEGGYVACVGTNISGARGTEALVNPAQANVVRTESGRALDDVVELASGRSGVCARRSSGELYCWGNVAGISADSGEPEVVPYARKIRDNVISVARYYGVTCVVTNPGGVLSCSGQQPPRISQVSLAQWGLTGVASVELHTSGGYATMADGSVMSFGSNRAGERGNGDDDFSPASAVTGLTAPVQVQARGAHPDQDRQGGAAVLADGTLWAWGSNDYGQLGNDDTSDSQDLVQVTTDGTTPLTGVTAVSAGRTFQCAIATGGVYCWGNDNRTALGAPGDSDVARLTDPPITDATAISSRSHGTCVVHANGTVGCFGEVLGESEFELRPVPAFSPAI
ncbi:MAG: hypothetical protein R2939_15130 [Kofleriaceae bacterium]